MGQDTAASQQQGLGLNYCPGPGFLVRARWTGYSKWLVGMNASVHGCLSLLWWYWWLIQGGLHLCAITLGNDVKHISMFPASAPPLFEQALLPILSPSAGSVSHSLGSEEFANVARLANKGRPGKTVQGWWSAPPLTPAPTTTTRHCSFRPHFVQPNNLEQ